MKQFYKLLLFFLIVAAPMAGVAQSKPGSDTGHSSSDTTVKICDTVYYWHGSTYIQTGDYTDTNGIKLHLTLYPLLDISITPSADTTFCGSGVLSVSNENPDYSYLWSSSTSDTLSTGSTINVFSSETYYVTAIFSDSTGPICSKSDSITIIVHQTYDTTFFVTICESQLPYTWGSIQFTEAGSQAITLTSDDGCDSVVTLSLTVNPIYTMTDTQTICVSQLPYSWNGVEFTEAGTQTTTLPTVNGCDSVVTMTLTVNPTYSVTDTRTICQDSLPYTWNGVEFTEAGTQTTTLESVNGCDSMVTMTLAVNPTYSETDTRTICQDSLPYTWNGVEFTEAGTQIANLETVNGCDSVVTMTLTVNPTYSVTDTKAICQDSLPYTWNGVTFTEAGTQTTTLQTVNGCDSVVTMTLTVNPTYAATDARTICQSELPYQWNGETFAEAGTQIATLQTVNGCDSVVTMTLTVNPSYSVTDTKTICQDSLPYLWNGVTFAEAGSQAATLPTVKGCDSIVTMTLTVNPTYNETDTKTICQDSLPYLWNGVTFAEAGTQTATLQTVSGCDSVVTMTLTVNATYAVTDTKTICQDSLPYLWNGVTFAEAGTQTATLQTVSGCDSVVTMTLTVNPTYAVIDAQTICASELPYPWNGVTFNAAGDTTVTLTAENGCDSVVTMTLTVNPIFSMSPISAEICQGGSYYFNGQPLTQSGHYYDTLQTIHGCDSVISLNLTVHNPGHSAVTIEKCGSYTWIVGDLPLTYTTSGLYTYSHADAHGCPQVDTLHLTIYQIPQTFLSAEICQGESYNFFGQTLNQTGVYTDTLSGTHCDSVIVLNLTVHPIAHSTIYDSICDGSTYDCFCGQQHSTAGPHVHTLQGEGMYGCDSIVTLYLSIVPMISDIKNIVSKRNADSIPYMLVYPDTGYFYQWYYMEGDTTVMIPGENKQYYAPKGGLNREKDCYYKLRIAPKGFAECGVFTDCWKDTSTPKPKMRIFPNPNDGHFRLILPKGVVNVQILNANGQIVMTRKVEEGELLELSTGLANGLYFVKIFRGDGSSNTEKLVINR